jgi:formylmethanofuran dehydrogenase subunit B
MKRKIETFIQAFICQWCGVNCEIFSIYKSTGKICEEKTLCKECMNRYLTDYETRIDNELRSK